jgi:hypothetical protein
MLAEWVVAQLAARLANLLAGTSNFLLSRFFFFSGLHNSVKRAAQQLHSGLRTG